MTVPLSAAPAGAQTTANDGAETSAQPLRTTQIGGVKLTVLGTAHVSKASADEVERLLETGAFDAVAIELDEGRYAALSDPDRWAKTDLFQLLREGKAAMMAASLALSAFQQRLAEQSGIESGEEMRRAIRVAKAKELPLLLIDRDIGITLRRVYGNVPFFQRLTLITGLLGSVFSREKVTPEEIEKLKEGDVLEATFAEFSENSQALFEPLIGERDRYMAARLRQETGQAAVPQTDPQEHAHQHPNKNQGARFKHVLVVIGAGHLKGLMEQLEAPSPPAPAAERAALETLPKSTPWLKILPWVVVGLIIVGFVIGFSRDQVLGWQLLRDWVLINGGLAALGAAFATAHPLTIVTAFVAAPITSLNPVIGVGMVTAGLELWLRKPQMGDFTSLRRDVVTVRGWWRNRVARTLLVFFLTSLGSVIGTYLAGFRILERLL